MRKSKDGGPCEDCGGKGDPETLPDGKGLRVVDIAGQRLLTESGVQAAIASALEGSNTVVALKTFNERLLGIEGRMRSVLVATMAATLLPQLLANNMPKDSVQWGDKGAALEEQIVDMAFRLATKLAKRMEKEMGAK